MNSASQESSIQKTFIEHIHELQKRLMWIVFFVIAFGLFAYSVNDQLLKILQKPIGQTLYYTSPIGGFSFIFKLCTVAGLILALPVILYHLFKFLGPMLDRQSRSTIIKYTFCSFLLAYAGIMFAYFVSLPSALHFLTKFGGQGIQSLIGADQYFNFALAYVGGFAFLFQLPLIVTFINRIKPLSPKKMMGTQRYIILGSFIVAAMLTPTPDPINQLIMALPMILLYQVSIVMIWLINRKARRKLSRIKQPTAQSATPNIAPSEARQYKTSELAPKVFDVTIKAGEMAKSPSARPATQIGYRSRPTQIAQQREVFTDHPIIPLRRTRTISDIL